MTDGGGNGRLEFQVVHPYLIHVGVFGKRVKLSKQLSCLQLWHSELEQELGHWTLSYVPIATSWAYYFAAHLSHCSEYLFRFFASTGLYFLGCLISGRSKWDIALRAHCHLDPGPAMLGWPGFACLPSDTVTWVATAPALGQRPTRQGKDVTLQQANSHSEGGQTWK